MNQTINYASTQEIKVLLHASGSTVPTPVYVCKRDAIETIKKYCPDTYILVYNGMMLSESMSFGFYGIENNDTIFSVPPKPIKEPKSSFGFRRLYSSFVDPPTEKYNTPYLSSNISTVARIVDNRMNLTEIKKKRRHFNAIPIIEFRSKFTSSDNTRIEYVRPDCPSTDTLPIIWKGTVK